MTPMHRSPKTPGPLGDWREHGRSLLSLLFARFWTLMALPFLVAGAALLGGATGLYQDRQAHATELTGLDETAEASVVGAWWRLGFDGRGLSGTVPNWTRFADPSFCLVVALQPPAPAATAVSCRYYGRILDVLDAPYQLRKLASGPAQQKLLPWRNAEGRMALEWHLPASGLRSLQERATPYPPYQHGWSPVPRIEGTDEVSYWWALMEAFEQPTEDLPFARGARTTVPVRFDPADPSRAAPVWFLDEATTPSPPFPMVILALAGAVFWAGGVRLFLFNAGRGWQLLTIVVTLACAPWWGQWIWKGVDQVQGLASAFGQSMQADMFGGASRLKLMAQDYRGEADDARVIYSLETSLYAPLFADLDLNPEPSRHSEDADMTSLERLQVQIATAIAGLDPASRRNRFLALACFTAAGQRGATDLFLPAASEWVDDGSVGRAARQFLEFAATAGNYYPNHRIDCDAALAR